MKPYNVDHVANRCGKRNGLSLLEVVIALTILAMSVALLARIIQLGTDNAMKSKDELQASLICESKLAEFALNTSPMQSTGWMQVMDQHYANKMWYYRIDALLTNQPDMYAVTVHVGDETSTQNITKPLASMTRWYINPALNLDVPPDQSTTSTTGGSTASTGGTQ